MTKRNLYIINCLLALCCFSCSKMITVDPPKTDITADKVFSNDESAQAYLSDTYSHFQSVSASLTTVLGLYADELNNSTPNTTNIEYDAGRITPSNLTNQNIWRELYTVIYQANDLIQNLDKYAGVTTSLKKQIIAECYFLRAFAYHFLVQLYGDIPLVLTTDVTKTSAISKSNSALIYDQIVSDLRFSENNLDIDYPSNDRVRANKWTAIALDARIELTQKNWVNAENLSDQVISSGIYSINPFPNEVFLKDSPETIFQCWDEFGYTLEGSLLIPDIDLIPDYPVSGYLLSSFNNSDIRKSAWTDSVIIDNTSYYYPFKYKNRTTGASTEYLVAFRLGEQYLIRAEAALQQNKIDLAINDLNIIRQRAGLLPVTNTLSQQELLNVVHEERRHELSAEWGTRFFDLKRIGQLDEILSPIKPLWQSSSALFPIPLYELQSNPLLTQNPGY